MIQFPPRVPTELEPLMDDVFLECHERWQHMTKAHLLSQMPDVATWETGLGEVHFPVLGPATPQRASDVAIALSLPHNQAWKPSMFIRAEYIRQQVNPHGLMYVFPQETHRLTYGNYTDHDEARLTQGNWQPMAARRMSAMERSGVPKWILTGYSLGGLQALATAVIGSTEVEIIHINADETTFGETSPKQVQANFRQSGTIRAMSAALKDAELPVLSQVLNVRGRIQDYAEFGFDMLLSSYSKAMMQMMGRGAIHLASQIYKNYPEASLKFGMIEGSLMTDPAAVMDFVGCIPFDFTLETYTGEYARGHATGDNPAFDALSLKHGLQKLDLSR